MTRRLLLAAVIVAVTMGLVLDPPRPQAQAAKKVVLAMAVTPPNLVHIPPYLAKDLGYFKEEGLEVDIISFEGGVGSLRVLLAGQVDVALTSGDPPIVARAKGAPIRLIYSPSPRLEAVLTVQGDIKELKDLKGRKIGIQEPNGFADIFSRRALAKAGLKPADAHFISTSTAGRVPALITGQVDTGVMHVEQAFRAIKRKPSLHTILNFWEAFPDALYNVFVTSEKKLKEDPEALTSFVKAVMKANRFMYKNRDRTLDAAAEITGYTREELEPAVDELIKGRVWSVNDGLPERMIAFNVENQARVGNIPADRKPTYEQVVDLGPATAAIKALGRWTDDPGWL
jgi:NitT/TauT family transport system substrate-binding protein